MMQNSLKLALFNYTVFLKLTKSQITRAMSTYSNHLCRTGHTVLEGGWREQDGNGYPVVESLEQGDRGRRKSPGPTVSHTANMCQEMAERFG